ELIGTIVFLRPAWPTSAAPPPAAPAPGPAGLGPWQPAPSSPPGPFPPARPLPAGAPSGPWPVPPAARPPRAARRLPRLTGAQLLAVTGGAVTLLGVVLLLVLAASRGWFDPAARVGLGGVVGLALVGIGVVLQRRRSSATAAADPGPVSLAATGITALYLSVAAAASLYDLLPDVPAVVLALLVAAGGLALADLWRHRGLALGVVVGVDLLVPLVVDAAGPLLVVLLVVVIAAALPVAARRGWPTLTAIAVAAAALVAVVVADTRMQSGATTAGLFAVAATIAVLLLVSVAAALVTAAAPCGDTRRATIASGVVLIAPLLPVLVLAPSLPRPAGAVLDVVAVLVLLGAALVFERGTGRVPVTPALTTTAVAAAAVLGLQAVPLALTGIAQGGVMLALATVLAVLARHTGRLVLLVVAGAFAVAGGILALGRDLPLGVVVAGDVRSTGTLVAMAVVGVLLTAAAGTLLAALLRSGRVVGRERAAAVIGGLGLVGLYGAAGTVVTLALAVSPTRAGFLVGHVLVTISWTALALVLLVRGVEAGLPRLLGGVLVVAAVAKLILFDLVALDGLARVVVFLGAGLVLLAAGTRYARLVASAGEEPGRLTGHE
ncbi:DUF2339 domain-containing protein, partial [Actinomycetospora atypica]